MSNSIKLVIGIAVVVVIGGGVYAFSGTSMAPQKDSEVMSEVMEKKEGEVMTEEAMLGKEESLEMMKEEGGGTAQLSFSGTVLAGASAPLLDFTKADYDKAVVSGKIVLLYFYANWCPICKAEFPKMQSAFNKLNTDQIVAFRVNYKDDQTDAAETDLARQFGVAYQHTKVFVKNGKQISKHPDSWEESRYLTEINKLLGA
ncbi:MAG: TlpA disulfide reductase family protein [Patescibacteria group bacterium]